MPYIENTNGNGFYQYSEDAGLLLKLDGEKPGSVKWVDTYEALEGLLRSEEPSEIPDGMSRFQRRPNIQNRSFPDNLQVNSDPEIVTTDLVKIMKIVQSQPGVFFNVPRSLRELYPAEAGTDGRVIICGEFIYDGYSRLVFDPKSAKLLSKSRKVRKKHRIREASVTHTGLYYVLSALRTGIVEQLLPNSEMRMSGSRWRSKLTYTKLQYMELINQAWKQAKRYRLCKKLEYPDVCNLGREIYYSLNNLNEDALKKLRKSALPEEVQFAKWALKLLRNAARVNNKRAAAEAKALAEKMASIPVSS